MKKYVLLVFALVFFLVGVSQSHAAFSDVSKSHPNYNAINYVQSQGIVSGYPDGTFRPDNKINRAEFLKIIVNGQLMTSRIDNCLSNLNPNWTYIFFTDVPRDQWFAKYVCAAKEALLVSGYNDGTFRPSQNVSFVEASKLISKSPSTTTMFLNPTEPWYKGYVLYLEAHKAIPSSIVTFDEHITRGEMAEMFFRLLSGYPDKDYSTKTYDQLKKLPVGTNYPERLGYITYSTFNKISGIDYCGLDDNAVFEDDEGNFYDSEKNRIGKMSILLNMKDSCNLPYFTRDSGSDPDAEEAENVPPTTKTTNGIPRGEFAKLVVEALLGDPFSGPGSPSFSDVPSSHEYYDAIETAITLGFMGSAKDESGAETGLFLPERTVTRADAIQIFVDGANPGRPCGDMSYTDVPNTHIAHEAIDIAYCAGLLDNSENTFRPDDPITQDEWDEIVEKAGV